MKNKIIMLALSAILLVSLSACNTDTSTTSSGIEDKSSSENKDQNVQNEKDENKQEEEQEKEDEKEKQTVKVYFSDNQAMNLIEVEVDIVIAKGESLESKVIEALKSQPSDAEMFNAVGENIVINSVKVEDKLAIVDLSSENLSGGSTEEMFLIDSIVASLTALDTVDQVKFLVDGKVAETLMGHAETTEAFTKDDISSSIITIEKTEK